MEPTRIIGVDYDSKAIHFAILEGDALRVQRYYSYPEQTLWGLLDGLTFVMHKFRPARLVVIEAPYAGRDPRAFFGLAQMFVMINLVCEMEFFVKVALANPSWKKLGLRNAKLKKEEVFEQMKQRFGGIIEDSHYADAAGMALAGLNLVKGG